MRILPLALFLLPLGVLASANSARTVRLRQMRAELAPRLRELQAA